MGKGTIVGGNVTATNMIIAKSIGSPMGTVTALQIGVPPNLFAEYKQLEQEMSETKERLNKVDQSISFLMTKNRTGQLDMQKKVMLQKLTDGRKPILDEYEEVRSRYKKVGDLLNNVKEGLIKCMDTIYPGVKVTFGNLVKYIDDEQAHVNIRKQDGEIYIGM